MQYHYNYNSVSLYQKSIDFVAEEYRISQVYKGKFQDKRGELGTLFVKIREIIDKSKVSLDELKEFLIVSYSELQNEIDTCESIKDVLKVVRAYTSLDDPSYLRCIAKHFHLQEAGGLIKLYDDSISRFCEEIPVEHSYAQDFMEHFRGKCLKSETVKFVLDWKADEKSLNDIRGILKKAFHKMAHNVKVMVVSEGNSIIVICYAPPHLAAVLTRLVEENEVDLIDEGVISVSICGYMVIKRDLQKEVLITCM